MKGKEITKSILRVASVLLLVFAVVKSQGFIAQAALDSYTVTMNDVDWNVYYKILAEQFAVPGFFIIGWIKLYN